MNRRDNKKLVGALTGFLLSTASLIGAEELILQESFETDGDGDRYTLIGGFVEDTDNYIGRREVFQTGTLVYGGTLDGTWMMGFQDLDQVDILSRSNGDLYEAEGMGAREGRLKFENIDITDYKNLRFEMAVANLGGNDPNDDLRIRVRIDGGDWIEIGGFKSSSSNFHTTYYTGPRDTIILADNPNRVFRFFSDWSWPIPAQGSSMELQITVEGNAGDEDHHIDNLRLWGDKDVLQVNASFAQGEVTEPESGGVVNTLNVTLEQPAPAGGATFSLEPIDRRAEYSLGLPSETLTIPEGQSSATMDVEIVQDGQYTGTKTVDLFLRAEGYSDSFARVIVTNVTPKPDLVITEILNVVPGTQADHLFGDANGDGVYHNGHDQFIEIVNFDDVPVDMSLMRIGDDLADRHQVPDGTILQPNEVMVVFGGGFPRGNFGGAIVHVATAGGNGLGFNISSRAETPYLNAQFGAPVDDVNVPPQRADFLAISNTLDPSHPGFEVSASVHALAKGPADAGRILDVPGNMHSIIEGAGQRLFSPGTWFDGTVYYEPVNQITVEINQEAISEDAGANAAEGTITLSNAAPAGGFEVTLDSDGVILNEDGSFVADEIDLDSLTVTVPEGATQATFRIGAVDDGILDGDRLVTINARGGAYVLGGVADVIVTDVAVSTLDVTINEIMSDVEGEGLDPNHDGVSNDGLGDQFIEVVNNGSDLVNLSGWHLEWEGIGVFGVVRTSHTFPEGTWLPNGGSIVVYGRITDEGAMNEVFGGAIVQEARNADGSLKANGLDLDIGETFDIRLINEHGFIVHEIEEVSSDVMNQGSSVTWGPDPLNPDQEVLIPHFEIDLKPFSPGLDIVDFAQVPFEGNSWVRLPTVFTQVNYYSGTGWFYDPTFGWVYTGMDAEAATWDLPWVYVDGEGYWFIYEESVSNGFFWAYDYEHSTWIYTGYGLYPWVWSANDSNWVQH